MAMAPRLAAVGAGLGGGADVVLQVPDVGGEGIQPGAAVFLVQAEQQIAVVVLIGHPVVGPPAAEDDVVGPDRIEQVAPGLRGAGRPSSRFSSTRKTNGITAEHPEHPERIRKPSGPADRVPVRLGRRRPSRGVAGQQTSGTRMSWYRGLTSMPGRRGIRGAAAASPSKGRYHSLPDRKQQSSRVPVTARWAATVRSSPALKGRRNGIGIRPSRSRRPRSGCRACAAGPGSAFNRESIGRGVCLVIERALPRFRDAGLLVGTQQDLRQLAIVGRAAARSAPGENESGGSFRDVRCKPRGNPLGCSRRCGSGAGMYP